MILTIKNKRIIIYEDGNFIIGDWNIKNYFLVLLPDAILPFIYYIEGYPIMLLD